MNIFDLNDVDLNDVDSELGVEVYVRTPLPVRALQITEENIEAVAKWCGGEIRTRAHENGALSYIKLRVIRPSNLRQTQGFVGDWVLQSEFGYKVYVNTAFEKNFVSAALKHPGLTADLVLEKCEDGRLSHELVFLRNSSERV